LELIFSPGDIAVQRRLRRVFDPLGLANPGKVLPEEAKVEDSGPASRSAGPSGGPETGRNGIDLRVLEAIVGEEHFVTATGGVATLQEGVSSYTVDGQMPLAKAHALTEIVEKEVDQVAPESDITIHVEPLPVKVKNK